MIKKLGNFTHLAKNILLLIIEFRGSVLFINAKSSSHACLNVFKISIKICKLTSKIIHGCKISIICVDYLNWLVAPSLIIFWNHGRFFEIFEIFSIFSYKMYLHKAPVATRIYVLSQILYKI